MVLHPHGIKPIPSLTKEIARKAFPKGNLYMTLRDELGTFYDDEDFAELYSSEGQPALRPGSLALICVMQYMANLSDRGAVEAVAARIDWKYVLGLELTTPSFDSSVLSLFRSRLLNGGKEQLLLNNPPSARQNVVLGNLAKMSNQSLKTWIKILRERFVREDYTRTMFTEFNLLSLIVNS